MLVTLEVSKLSGWLNLYASCREYTKMVMQQFELRAGRRPREAHLEHFGDALDAGRVSKLSGWLKLSIPCREYTKIG